MGSPISEPLNLLFGETKFFLFHFITPCLEVDSKYPNYYDNNHKLLLLVSIGRSPHLPFVIEGIMEVMGAVACRREINCDVLCMVLRLVLLSDCRKIKTDFLLFKAFSCGVFPS